jgi:hypothetical protein
MAVRTAGDKFESRCRHGVPDLRICRRPHAEREEYKRHEPARQGIENESGTIRPPGTFRNGAFSEMIPLRRASSFRKRKFPGGMKPFKIRTPLEETAVKLQTYAAWLFFSPLVLAFQALPTTETETRVVTE